MTIIKSESLNIYEDDIGLDREVLCMKRGKETSDREERSIRECFFILGGTFDPIHRGHIYILEHLSRLYPNSRRILMPNKHPEYKKVTVGYVDRVNMIKAAIEGTDIEMSTLEIDREAGDSQTIDTVQELRLQYPDAALIWVLGDDAMNSIDQWQDWDELVDFVHLYVIPREGLAVTQAVQAMMIERQVKEATGLFKSTCGLIYMDESFKRIGLSATQVREELSQNNRCDRWLTDSVKKYIERNHLYRE